MENFNKLPLFKSKAMEGIDSGLCPTVDSDISGNDSDSTTF
jgi:hypothetical protein